MEHDQVEEDSWFDDGHPEPEIQTVFKVKTYAYCGMTFDHGEYDTLEEALERAQIRTKYLSEQQGAEVVSVGDNEWEVLEPEGCVLVPDFCGTLRIIEVEKSR